MDGLGLVNLTLLRYTLFSVHAFMHDTWDGLPGQRVLRGTVFDPAIFIEITQLSLWRRTDGSGQIIAQKLVIIQFRNIQIMLCHR